jgi:hypothetical protein
VPNKNNNNVPAQTSALSRLAIFGPIPLLAGESAAAYDDLLARVSGNLKPSDIFEEIWVREIVDLIWETLRWRRHQAGFIKAAVPKVLGTILKPLASEPASRRGSFIERLRAEEKALKDAPELASEWAAGDPAATQRVNQLLESIGVTMDDVVTQAVAQELDKIERFNRLIAGAEWRRNALLREIDRRRASFAQKLRSEVHKIEAAETIEPDTGVAAVTETETANANVIAPTEVTQQNTAPSATNDDAIAEDAA